MQEIVDADQLVGVAETYPGASKVTVDADNRIAYVFVGRSNQAQTVTGEAFDELVKVLPAPPVKATPVIEEPDEEPASQPKARAKRQKES